LPASESFSVPEIKELTKSNSSFGTIVLQKNTKMQGFKKVIGEVRFII
jgi:hypothetical protein